MFGFNLWFCIKFLGLIIINVLRDEFIILNVSGCQSTHYVHIYVEMYKNTLLVAEKLFYEFVSSREILNVGGYKGSPITPCFNYIQISENQS